MDQRELTRYLVREGREWVRRQRDLNYPNALVLSQRDREVFTPFFNRDILDRARTRHVGRIESPPFHEEARRLGIPRLLDFSGSLGITFVDWILISDRFSPSRKSWLSLLFHELVHVAQYHLLGTDGFVGQYVKGWVENDHEYLGIPLENQAYELQRRFDQGEGGFSVEALLQE